MFFKENSDNIPIIISEYLSYLKTIKGSSPKTIISYKIDLCTFFRFLNVYYKIYPIDDKFNPREDLMNVDISNIDIEYIQKIELEDIYAFMNFVEEYRDNNAVTRKRKLICIKSFYKYLNKRKLLDTNLTLDLESPKLPQRLITHLSYEESKILLDSIKSRNISRDRAIITLFLNTGIRLSELCSINISNIKDDYLYIIGKGNKERSIYLNKSCTKAIKIYMYTRMDMQTKIIDPDSLDALFLSEQKKRISPRTVQKLVKTVIANAELDNKITPHKLRHTFATLLYRAGADIRTLQQILGHSNLNTTQLYTHVDKDNIKNVININPLNN